MLRKYTLELLLSFCDENNIKVLDKYTDNNIYGNSMILITCKQCNNSTYKRFDYLYKTSRALCKPCITKNSLPKQKLTMLQKYGVEHPTQSKDILEVTKQRNIEKYGVDNPSKTQIVKDKQKQTCLHRYGVEYMIHNPSSREKMIQTNIEKYGTDNPAKNSNVQLKMKETNLKKYGVDNPAKNIDIQIKMRETTKQKYGVEYPLQNTEISSKLMEKNRYKIKIFKFPSGKTIKCQGYEHFCIKNLIDDDILETDIITERKYVPEIWYNDIDNNKHRYFPDIFIPSKNLIIEVKSNWTYKIDENKINLCKKSISELGYNYEIWIYNCKGDKINCIK